MQRVSNFRVLPGLPAYGAAALTIPAEWGRGVREGLVVEFVADTGEIWVGNFQPGFGGIDDVRQHPNGHDVIVVSAGSAWVSIQTDARPPTWVSPSMRSGRCPSLTDL